MIAATRTPGLLVKLPAAPERAAIRFGKHSVTAGFERLFNSIRPERTGLDAVAEPEWYMMSAGEADPEVNAWDLCHHVVANGLCVAGSSPAQFAEPDLEQQWNAGTPAPGLFSASGKDPDLHMPSGNGRYWFRDAEHSQLEAARVAVGEPSDRIRIAHLDTGYDPNHRTLPRFLRKDLQRNFVDRDRPDDASDRSSGTYNNLGHGTGTLSILAGAEVDGSPLGGAPFLDVVPVRVANAVILFRNSAIARAFDYVHGLYPDAATRVLVVSMSMGGLASKAWTDAVNSLYERGVVVVTAAGNNFGNLPTRNIVYPARFRRVLAACGAMADGTPYANLPRKIMAGNYGPASKMDTAIAAFTPNTPWARFGSESIVDYDGCGTSAATPQVAAAAALWIQRYHAGLFDAARYPEEWMRVEAVRKALFDSALKKSEMREFFGNGFIQANAALSQLPAGKEMLKKQPVDHAGFPLLRTIAGLGIAGEPGVREQMLELEALQISQQLPELAELLPDPAMPGEISPADRQRILELLHDAPGASSALRQAVGGHAAPVVVPNRRSKENNTLDQHRLSLALNPPIAPPAARRLRVYAFDPLLGYRPESLHLNETTLEVNWEDLAPGPVGEYLEVVDVDPATGCCYAPVDLNHPSILASAGLEPSESSPRFHQQMVYAVAMKTIKHFETALGRVALWAPRFVKDRHDENIAVERQYVRRLRIYPHALREKNAFYSPDKKALLLGYFNAHPSFAGDNLPGGTIFCCLSHDIVAHETTHALLDGLHRYFAEPTNPDVLAFHEGFADIVALFQHFAIPEALRDQISRNRGDLSQQNILAELAQQFGQGLGGYGALRNALGKTPSTSDYRIAEEVHDRGSVLVAAVFDAFTDIYRRRSADLIRLATGGSGILPDGAIPGDLVNRLVQEASKTARHVLNICIRALDYCPPVDPTFGEYLRALITADRDLVPRDHWGYRAAFIQGFRRRGIYPPNVRNLSPESLCWEAPELQIPIGNMLDQMELTWDLHCHRERADQVSSRNAREVRNWIMKDPAMTDEIAESLGFYRHREGELRINGRSGTLRPFEVHSVRPVRRIGPDGQQQTDLIIEIVQTWVAAAEGSKFRGGCTLLIDLENRMVRYVVRKKTGHAERAAQQERFRMLMVRGDSEIAYALKCEPFAFIHNSGDSFVAPGEPPFDPLVRIPFETAGQTPFFQQFDRLLFDRP